MTSGITARPRLARATAEAIGAGGKDGSLATGFAWTGQRFKTARHRAESGSISGSSLWSFERDVVTGLTVACVDSSKLGPAAARAESVAEAKSGPDSAA